MSSGKKLFVSVGIGTVRIAAVVPTAPSTTTICCPAKVEMLTAGPDFTVIFTTVVSVGEVAVRVAPPPDTLAVFDTLGTATTPTLAVNVIVLLAVGAMEPAFVQVTAWPKAEQLQPVPEPTMNVRPAGSVSVTVIVPLVEPVPTFFTVRV